MDVLPHDEIIGYATLGELSLDGSLNPVTGILPATIGALARDLGLICPASQGGEAAGRDRIEVLAPPDLLSLINHFRGTQVLTPPNTAGVAETASCPDLSDVKGMETAKRALEIAAAGGRNLLKLCPITMPGRDELDGCLAVLVRRGEPYLADLVSARVGGLVTGSQCPNAGGRCPRMRVGFGRRGCTIAAPGQQIKHRGWANIHSHSQRMASAAISGVVNRSFGSAQKILQHPSKSGGVIA
jgi:hypothetical protein